MHLGHISLWSMWHLIALGIITLPIIIGLFFLGQAYIRYKTTELAITSKRVIVKTGFIRRRTVEINLSKVESIGVVQKPLFSGNTDVQVPPSKSSGFFDQSGVVGDCLTP